MAEDSSTSSKKRTSYHRERYRSHPILKLRAAVRYYQKKEKGETWMPKEWTALYRWCQEKGLDVAAMIEGRESLGSSTK